jgi:hypothetical protein
VMIATSETVCPEKLTSEFEMLPFRDTAVSNMLMMRMSVALSEETIEG